MMMQADGIAHSTETCSRTPPAHHPGAVAVCTSDRYIYTVCYSSGTNPGMLCSTDCPTVSFPIFTHILH